MRTLRISLLAATSLALASTAFAAAAPNNTLMEYQGVEFACSGVGNTAQQAGVWDQFPAKLVFTNAAGDYLGDVKVTVMNQNGGTVLDTRCQAPWLMANLAEGQYSAKAVSEGHEETFDFTVSGSDQSEVVVKFDELKGT